MLRFPRRPPAFRRSVAVPGLLMTSLVSVMLASVPASASAPAAEQPPKSTPSDDRATFVEGNVAHCSDAGYPDSVQIYGEGNEDAGDAFVQGTGYGSSPTKLQVEITPAGTTAGVVIDAVVVKGGDAANIYKSPNVPPQLAAPQDYISPTNNGGNVADISHYLICYHIDDSVNTPTGALLPMKRVVAPEGGAAADLPTSYAAEVQCTAPDGTRVDETVTFNAGGGVGTTSTGSHLVRGLPEGSVCKVTEQGTDGFPDGTEVTYRPSGASSPGVTIGSGPGAAVLITNDFSGTEAATASFTITKEVEPAAGADPSATFTVDYACQGPKTGSVELSPGETATVDGIRADAHCIVAEPNSEVPDGWNVAYTVDGKSQLLPPVFAVSEDKAVAVTVKNSDLTEAPSCPDGQMQDPTDPTSCIPIPRCPEGEVPNPLKPGACFPIPNCPDGQTPDLTKPSGCAPIPECPDGQVTDPKDPKGCVPACPDGVTPDKGDCPPDKDRPGKDGPGAPDKDGERAVSAPQETDAAAGAFLLGGAALAGLGARHRS